MMEAAAAALISLLVRQEWYCSSALEPDMSTALRLGFQLSADGQFDGYGIVMPLRTAQRFDWSGNWTLLDGQLVMIGATRGQSFGIAPTGELRGMARVTQGDVIVLDAANDGGAARTMRCLTYKLE
ncbi:MAG: hypothetical protein AAF227_04005 [Pseudomonadota bacterium]